MICIRCEVESPAGYRFCGNCGAALEPTSRRPATMPEREGGERRGKKGERERRYDRRADDVHAAFVVSWLNTAAIFRQPSIAKIEHHLGELFPRVGFIVTTLTGTNRAVVRFYNQRGTAEQWIKEGKAATHWTRLSCPASGPTRAACCSE